MTLSSVPMKFAYALLALLLLLVQSSNSFAVPVRSNGGACDSTGSARRDGKDQNGNKVNCLFDSCTYTECGTSGGTISNCVKKTEYSNPTDCHAALTIGTTLGTTQLGNLGVQQDFGSSNPTGPSHHWLVSLQVTVTESELHQACDKAGGMFSAGSKLYQCVAMNGDVLSCRVTTQSCTGSLVLPKRPPTLLGFATAPFGKGAGYVPPAGTRNPDTNTTSIGGAEGGDTPVLE